MEIELTPEQREVVYLEERSKLENGCEGSTELLVVLNVIAAAALVGLFFVSKTAKERKISLDSIHKAYSGLSPDEIIDW